MHFPDFEQIILAKVASANFVLTNLAKSFLFLIIKARLFIKLS